MSWQSTVPAVIEALVAAFSAEPEISDIVRDGPMMADEAALEAVFVGYTGGTDDTATDGRLVQEGLAMSPDREEYSVRCAAAVLNGASDMTAARTRVYELLAAAGAAIVADTTLGGVVMSAGLGETRLLQSQRQEGAYATVTFDVDVDAFTVR